MTQTEPARKRPMLSAAGTMILVIGASLMAVSMSYAQLDPEPRQLLHLGISQSLHDDGPEAHYLFYYWNMVNVPSTNQILRLVLAPTYLNGELGFQGALGANSDLALGLFGGGYANNYDEIRKGNYFRAESFEGHGGGANVSIYHLFNPRATVPLNGLLRATAEYRAFDSGSDTDEAFELPEDQPFITLRAGLRWGGVEPILLPRLAAEISGWYELEYRNDHGHYGFGGDRRLEATSHRFFGRAEFHYTLPHAEHSLAVGLMGGAVLNVDRFSAFRVGGAFPFTSEFPLYLPGYFYGELSSEDFGLLYGFYSVPVGSTKRWNIMAGAAGAVVDYVDGLEQSGDWHSGVGGGVGYTSKNRRWRTVLAGAYGIDAIRSDGRGGYSLGMLAQYNFGKTTFPSDRAFEELRGARVPVR